jgi:hypothetical protein
MLKEDVFLPMSAITISFSATAPGRKKNFRGYAVTKIDKAKDLLPQVFRFILFIRGK